jgi:uncharacterized protein YidB (DUF937 family)
MYPLVLNLETGRSVQSFQLEEGSMGLFDEVVKQAAGALAQSSGEHSGVLEGIMDLMNNKEEGGLQGLVTKFTENGLGDIVNSWVGTGENLPVSSNQIQSAIGGLVEQVAAKAGVSPSIASAAISQLLPMVVDKLTPGGTVPSKIPDLGSLGKLLDIFK